MAVQTVMWRLRPRIVRYPEILLEVRDLGWTELRLREELRILQLQLDAGKRVIIAQ